MYITMFTAMLLSIIALSFVRIMLSEAQLTSNYSLSQSAYNSAMAGIEDAKVILLKYQNCQSTQGRVGSAECSRIAAAIEAEDAYDNCDIIREAHGDTSSNGETLISSSETSNATVEDTARRLDQAYTCVKINTESPDYLAKLNQNNSSKIIPIRVRSVDDNGNGINEVNRILIQWFSNSDVTKVVVGENLDTSLYRSVDRNEKISINHTSQDANDALSYSISDFKGKAVVAPYLKVELFQSAELFSMNQFYAAYGTTTNRGTLVLRPTNATETSGITHIGNDSSIGFAASATKTYNFPVDVSCIKMFNNDPSGTPTSDTVETYACTADIVIPSPVTTNYYYDYTNDYYRGIGSDPTRVAKSRNRNPTSMFLRVSLPYKSPETTVRTQLYNCADSSTAITGCTVINFFGVQPLVDSTGRANDLFRRVEARLEMVNTYFPYPDSALSVYGDDGLSKNFWVTDNCFAQSTTLNTETNEVITNTYISNTSGKTDTDTQKYFQCYNSGTSGSIGSDGTTGD